MLPPRIKDVSRQDTEHRTIDVDHKIADTLGIDGLHDGGCLFVTSKNGVLEGIVTDGDIRRVLKKNIDISEVLIKDVMTTEFHSAYEESSLVEAYQLMASEGINHLPIVNSKKALTGFIAFHELAARLSPEHLLIDLSEDSERPENEHRHIHRYKFASNFIGPGDKVLDGACGSGYGSEIMSINGARVTGIDANHEAIEFANQHYAKNSVEFLVGEIGKLKYVTSAQINDWRYDSEESGIMTTLFIGGYSWGPVKASDDIEVLEWHEIKEFDTSEKIEWKIMPEHRALMETLIKKIQQGDLGIKSLETNLIGQLGSHAEH